MPEVLGSPSHTHLLPGYGFTAHQAMVPVGLLMTRLWSQVDRAGSGLENWFVEQFTECLKSLDLPVKLLPAQG